MSYIKGPNETRYWVRVYEDGRETHFEFDGEVSSGEDILLTIDHEFRRGGKTYEECVQCRLSMDHVDRLIDALTHWKSIKETEKAND